MSKRQSLHRQSKSRVPKNLTLNMIDPNTLRNISFQLLGNKNASKVSWPTIKNRWGRDFKKRIAQKMALDHRAMPPIWYTPLPDVPRYGYWVVNLPARNYAAFKSTSRMLHKTLPKNSRIRNNRRSSRLAAKYLY